MRAGLARRSIIMAGFAFISAGGLLVYLFGSQEPWAFAVCLFPATIMGSCIRTPGANPMRVQQDESRTSGEEFQVHHGGGGLNNLHHLPGFLRLKLNLQVNLPKALKLRRMGF